MESGLNGNLNGNRKIRQQTFEFIEIKNFQICASKYTTVSTKHKLIVASEDLNRSEDTVINSR